MDHETAKSLVDTLVSGASRSMPRDPAATMVAILDTIADRPLSSSPPASAADPSSKRSEEPKVRPLSSRASSSSSGTDRRRAQKQAQLAVAAEANAQQMEELQKLLAVQRTLMHSRAEVESAEAADELGRMEKERLKSEKRDLRDKEKKAKKEEKERERERERMEKERERVEHQERKAARQLKRMLRQKAEKQPSPDEATMCVPPSHTLVSNGSSAEKGDAEVSETATEIGVATDHQRPPSPMLLSADEHLAATSVNLLVPPVSVTVGDGDISNNYADSGPLISSKPAEEPNLMPAPDNSATASPSEPTEETREALALNEGAIDNLLPKIESNAQSTANIAGDSLASNRSLTIIVAGGTSNPLETRAELESYSTQLSKRRTGGNSPAKGAVHVVPVPPSPEPVDEDIATKKIHTAGFASATPPILTDKYIEPNRESGGCSPGQDDDQHSNNEAVAVPDRVKRTPSAVPVERTTFAVPIVEGRPDESTLSQPSVCVSAEGVASGVGSGGSFYSLSIPVVINHIRSLDMSLVCTHLFQWAITASPQLLESTLFGRDLLQIVEAMASALKLCLPFLESMLHDDNANPSGRASGSNGMTIRPTETTHGEPDAEDSVTTAVSGGSSASHNPAQGIERVFDNFFVTSFGDEFPAIGNADESSFFVDGFVKELEKSLGRQLSDDELRQWYSFAEIMFRANRNGPHSLVAFSKSGINGSTAPSKSYSSAYTQGYGGNTRGPERARGGLGVSHRSRQRSIVPSDSASNAGGSVVGGSTTRSTAGSSLTGHGGLPFDLHISREAIFITRARLWLPKYVAMHEEAYRRYHSGAASTTKKATATVTPNDVSDVFAPVEMPPSELDQIKYAWTLMMKTTRSEFGIGVVREMLVIMPSLGRTGPLRNANMQQLGAQLELLFGTVVAALNDILTVVPSILQLGARHVGYGLTSEYAEVFIVALDVTLAKLLKEETYSAQMKAAWEGFARFILEVMSAGATQPQPDKKRLRRGKDGNQASLSSLGGIDTASVGSSRSRRSVSSFHSMGASSRGGGSQFHGHTLNPSTTHIKASSESMLSYERSLTSHGSVNVLDDNATTLLQLFREVLRSDVTSLLSNFDELLALCLSDLTQSSRYAHHIIVHELKLVPPIGNGVYHTPSQQGATGSPPVGSGASSNDAYMYTQHGGFDSSAVVGMLLRYISLLRTMFANRKIITIAAVKRALLFYRFFGFENFEPVRLLLGYVGRGRLKYELCMQRVGLPLSALLDSAKGSEDFTQSARVLKDCWSMVRNRELLPQLLFMISGQLAALPNMATWRTPSHFMRKVHIMGVVEIINVLCGVHGVSGNILEAESPSPAPTTIGPTTASTGLDPSGQLAPDQPHLMSGASKHPPGRGDGNDTSTTSAGGGTGSSPTGPNLEGGLPGHALVVGPDVQRACARLGLWLRVLGLEQDAGRVVDIIISSIWDVLQYYDNTRRFMLMWSFRHSICAMVQCGALPHPCTMADRRACDIHWQIVLSKLSSKEINVTMTGVGFGLAVGGGYATGAGGNVTVIDELIRLLPSLKQGLFRRVSINALNEVHRRFMTKVVDTALYGRTGRGFSGGQGVSGVFTGGGPADSFNPSPSIPSTRRSIISSLPHEEDGGRRGSTNTASESATITTTTSDHSLGQRNVITLVIPPAGSFASAATGGQGRSGGHGGSILGDSAYHNESDSSNEALQTSDLPLQLPPSDEEELRQLGLQHTIWGVLEEHYPVFITAFLSYLRLLHIQNPAVMPPVTTVPVTSWLCVMHYLASRMSSTAASARAMLHKHSDAEDLRKIIIIQSLQRGRMARNDAHKRRVFQDVVVRAILGSGPTETSTLPPGIPPEVGANRHRQQAYFRRLELERMRSQKGKTQVQESEANIVHPGGGGNTDRDVVLNGSPGRRPTALAQHRERGRALQSLSSHQRVESAEEAATNSSGLSTSLKAHNRRDKIGDYSLGSKNPSARRGGGPDVRGAVVTGYVTVGRMGGKAMPVNTVHVGSDDEPDTDGDQQFSNDGSKDPRGRKGRFGGNTDLLSSMQFSEDDDGVEWEVLDGEISHGLDRLLVLLWASIGPQGRNGAVQGALRDYSERYQRRLFGSASAGKAELRGAGELILQMMAFYGKLEEPAPRCASHTTSLTGDSQRSVGVLGSSSTDGGGVTGGSATIFNSLRKRSLADLSRNQLSSAVGHGDSPFSSPHPSLLPVAPFVLRRLFLHDPSLHNLPQHYYSRQGMGPLLPFHGPHHPPLISAGLSATAGSTSKHRFQIVGSEGLMPSPPKGKTSQRVGGVGGVARRPGPGGAGIRQRGGETVSYTAFSQRPLLPTGEPPLSEVGLEEMIILFEDTDFGHILIERILSSCPEEHKHHPAVRQAWLQLYSCILYNLKLTLDPSVSAPTRTAAAMMRRGVTRDSPEGQRQQRPYQQIQNSSSQSALFDHKRVVSMYGHQRTL